MLPKQVEQVVEIVMPMIHEEVLLVPKVLRQERPISISVEECEAQAEKGLKGARSRPFSHVSRRFFEGFPWFSRVFHGFQQVLLRFVDVPVPQLKEEVGLSFDVALQAALGGAREEGSGPREARDVKMKGFTAFSWLFRCQKGLFHGSKWLKIAM